MRRGSAGRFVAAVLLTAAIVAGCSGGGDDAAPSTSAATTTTVATTSTTASEASELSVMTRNLYLGADLVPLLEATSDDLATAAQAVWDQVEASEVQGRMAAVAAEIAATAPDVVALQEASLYTTQPEGASEPTVLHDFLQSLLDELQALDEAYTVAVSSDGFAGALLVEGVGVVTLQDRDVILVREGSVSITATDAGVFEATLPVDVAGIPIELERSWASIEADLDGRAVTVVATHLEAFDDPTRDAQQVELVEIVDAMSPPTIVVGDFNSAPAGTGTDPNTYDAMVEAGYTDAWGATDGGLTCCFSADLGSGELTRRIDIVFHAGDVEVLAAEVVGTDEGERTEGGRWPSDHAGVVVTLLVGS